MLKLLSKIVIITIALVLFSVLAFGATKNELTLTGSTTVLPIAQAAAEYYMNNVDKHLKITVNGGGSGVGIAAIINKTVDIGDASREIEQKEIDQAKSKGVNPHDNIIAMDGIVIILNSSVTGISNLTIDQIKKIYSGEIKNWKELGGSSGDIVVVSRDTSSGTYGTFVDLVLGKTKMIPEAMMTASNQQVATTVSGTPNSIGYIGIGYLKSASNVKAVKVNGIEATDKTVKDKSYKLSRYLHMYTNGAPKGFVKKFIDFILSNKGQDIVEESGFVKLK